MGTARSWWMPAFGARHTMWMSAWRHHGWVSGLFSPCMEEKLYLSAHCKYLVSLISFNFPWTFRLGHILNNFFQTWNETSTIIYISHDIPWSGSMAIMASPGTLESPREGTAQIRHGGANCGRKLWGLERWTAVETIWKCGLNIF